MKKKKLNKAIPLVCLAIAFVVPSFFLSQYLFQFINRQEQTAGGLSSDVIIESMKTNQMHLMLFISISMIGFLIIVLIASMGGNQDFRSEMDEVTDTIKTPKKVGQSQHGSARWLLKNEFGKTFQSYTLNPKNNIFLKGLTKSGINNIKEVKNCKNGTDKKGKNSKS